MNQSESKICFSVSKEWNVELQDAQHATVRSFRSSGTEGDALRAAENLIETLALRIRAIRIRPLASSEEAPKNSAVA